MATNGKKPLNEKPMEKTWSRYSAIGTRLRREAPELVDAISDQELEKQVEEACKAAEVLAFVEPEHVYRFIRLRYLPASCWQRPGAEDMLTRVLTDTSVEAGRRLDFIETVAKRPPIAGIA
ncbi:MAG: hypothetical protein U0572_10115 [Phycisphaerales bacterium]